MPEPAPDSHDSLEKELHTGTSPSRREIYLTGPIWGAPEDPEDRDWRSWFLAAFRSLDAGEGPIVLWVGSPGGDVSSMFLAYDLIVTARNPVITVGCGEICSAAVLLLVAGKRRLVTRNASLMSHEGRGGLSGELSAKEGRGRMRWFEWTEERWAQLMAEHTSKSAATWEKMSEKQGEYWLLGGAEMVEAGLADEVVFPGLGRLEAAIQAEVLALSQAPMPRPRRGRGRRRPSQAPTG